jgi:hypothetical protein
VSKYRNQSDERIGNLGLAAYLKMQGCKVTGRSGNIIFFECKDSDESDRINQYKIDYVNSIFAEFDGWLMTMKNMPVVPLDVVNPALQKINSMGIATFIKMRSNWRLVGRSSNNIFVFMVPVNENNKFQDFQFEWANHPLRTFDSSMMSLKSIKMKR